MPNGEQTPPSGPTPQTSTPISPFTAYPSTLGYVWGCPVPEAGITLESYEQNDQVSIFEQRNEVNTVVEAITHDPRSEITILGQTTATTPQILGKPVSIANLVLTQMGVAGLVMCTGVQYTNRRDANQSVRITCRHYPLITAPPSPTPVGGAPREQKPPEQQNQ
jgi:hypothetical protein